MPWFTSRHSAVPTRDGAGSSVHDQVALHEIELCCELMIAASTAHTDRLSAARIDEVLRVPRQRRPQGTAAPGGDGSP